MKCATVSLPGDIGTHFYDGQERWRNAESFVFLRFAVGLMREKGFTVVNVDSIISLEKPKLREYIDEMRDGIAAGRHRHSFL